MPRIDPERLLKTLAPLLKQTSGAIKSQSEVDKIYGLMSKFSKKLVSKCTYINILRSTQPDVLDLFFSRGGWDMVLGWTVDAVSKKNYQLLKEICNLLLYAPTTTQRLKDNELPKVIKSISKECENAEVRELGRQVVQKWIAIARAQQQALSALNSTSNSSQGQPGVNLPATAPPLQSCSVSSSKPMGELENTSGDPHFDLSQVDLSALHDFNPEDFSKVVDQHLGLSELMASGNAVVHSVDNNSVVVNSSEDIKINLQGNDTLVVKTVSGKLPSSSAPDDPSTSSTGEPVQCIVMKNGKPYLVRLKLANPQEVSALHNQASLQEISSTSNVDLANVQKASEKHVPNILQKTYSKKIPEVIPTPLEDASKSKSKSSDKHSKSSDKKEKDSKHKSSSSRSSGSKSSSAAAAAAAKKFEEDKLKEKIREKKAMLKKRQKEAEKQKQLQEKDQETLKKLNLTREPSVTAAPNSQKFIKIPKKQPSFADAIGIPDSESEKSPKKKTVENNETSDASTKTKGSPSEVKDKDKERRHRVKVFTSKKSRADDLLKDMTENIKTSKSNKAEGSKPVETGEKTLAGNSLIFKPEKRHTTDNMEKPGDLKKPKITDDQAEKKKDKAKEKERKSTASHIKESSLFMDVLAASSDSQKNASKRKRRLSSTAHTTSIDKDKEKDRSKSLSRQSSVSENHDTLLKSPPVAPAKPVFNFYRETLNDDNKLVDAETVLSQRPADTSTEEPMEIELLDAPTSPTDSDVVIVPNEVASPRLKGVLVIHRSKSKPKKSVKWKEENELTRMYTFELDEEERVNVTKHKDFLALKEQEKAREKQEFLARMARQGRGQFMDADDGQDAEESTPWRKPQRLLVLRAVRPDVQSQQRFIQEERERLNLSVFLPPGSTLPDPSEPDPSSPSEDENVEPRIIPSEDIEYITKVFDNTNLVWPNPLGDPFGVSTAGHRTGVDALQAVQQLNQMAFKMQQPSGQGHIDLSAFGNRAPTIPNFSTPQGMAVPMQMDASNPWNVASVPSRIGVPENMNGMARFQGVPNISIPPGGINYPPPNLAAFGFQSPGGIGGMPGFSAGGMNYPRNAVPPRGIPPDSGMRGGHQPNQRGMGRGGPGAVRDYGDRDFRRSFKDQDMRNRDGYESRRSRNDRGRDHNRDRDRDRRSPSPRRRRDDRDRGDRDKDYRDHDYRGRHRSDKKDVPCRYFSKGRCTGGAKCEFSHEIGNNSNGSSRGGGGLKPSRFSDGPPQPPSNDGDNPSSPGENWEDSSNQFERRNSLSDAPEEIADTPSSPTTDPSPASPESMLPPIIPIE